MQSHLLAAEQSFFLQAVHGQGHMALGHAPAGSHIGSPVIIRVVVQEQNHIQLIPGQVPLLADGVHHPGVTFSGPEHGFKVIITHIVDIHKAHLIKFIFEQFHYTALALTCQEKFNSKIKKELKFLKALGVQEVSKDENGEYTLLNENKYAIIRLNKIHTLPFIFKLLI